MLAGKALGMLGILFEILFIPALELTLFMFVCLFCCLARALGMLGMLGILFEILLIPALELTLLMFVGLFCFLARALGMLGILSEILCRFSPGKRA